MALPNYEQLLNKFGEIIENSSNGAAKAVKFDDGTLIQYGFYTIKAVDSRSAGGLTYYSGTQDITLPEFFLDSNYVAVSSVQLANMNLFCQSYTSPVGTDKLRLDYISTTQNEERRVSFICIGRWKQ